MGVIRMVGGSLMLDPEVLSKGISHRRSHISNWAKVIEPEFGRRGDP